jgi:alkanesulfonate monooxygenase SsuD/methylene tetrahydromethanopterin reductase-like flavin-dependent oxidoreductase (luciferase family)
MPAISIVATPTKRVAILELAGEAERRGFGGLACPSLGATLGLCVSLAHTTDTLRFWTSIQPIYYSHPVETGNTAAHIHEISGGRFALGLGVSHGPVTQRLGVATGKPLTDMRDYVAAMRANERFSGVLPPIYLATLRDKMLTLACQIAQGAIWANASCRHMSSQLSNIPAEQREEFFVANMVPTVVSEDREAALRVHRKTLTGYVSLPNYRNYWRLAGYDSEMNVIEDVLATTPKEQLAERLMSVMSDAWLKDCTVSGSATQVRDQFETWTAAGVLPIAVMSSTSGGQAKAIQELFDVYS